MHNSKLLLHERKSKTKTAVEIPEECSETSCRFVPILAKELCRSRYLLLCLQECISQTKGWQIKQLDTYLQVVSTKSNKDAFRSQQQGNWLKHPSTKCWILAMLDICKMFDAFSERALDLYTWWRLRLTRGDDAHMSQLCQPSLFSSIYLYPQSCTQIANAKLVNCVLPDQKFTLHLCMQSRSTAVRCGTVECACWSDYFGAHSQPVWMGVRPKFLLRPKHRRVFVCTLVRPPFPVSTSCRPQQTRWLFLCGKKNTRRIFKGNKETILELPDPVERSHHFVDGILQFPDKLGDILELPPPTDSQLWTLQVFSFCHGAYGRLWMKLLHATSTYWRLYLICWSKSSLCLISLSLLCCSTLRSYSWFSRIFCWISSLSIWASAMRLSFSDTARRNAPCSAVNTTHTEFHVVVVFFWGGGELTHLPWIVPEESQEKNDGFVSSVHLRSYTVCRTCIARVFSPFLWSNIDTYVSVPPALVGKPALPPTAASELLSPTSIELFSFATSFPSEKKQQNACECFTTNTVDAWHVFAYNCLDSVKKTR